MTRVQRREPEHAEQAALLVWVRRHEQRYPLLLELYAVPNMRSKKWEAGWLWAEGVRPGVPDLNLDVARGGFHGLRVEMKAPGRITDLSPEQRARIQRLQENGYQVIVCDNWRRAWNVLVHYLELPVRLKFE